MTAAYASVQALLAQGSEYLPDAQAGRDLYFMGKTQSMILPPVSSPAVWYQSRIHLLPSTERIGYGRSGMNMGLQNRLSDNLLELGKRSGNINYGSNLGYLVSPREVEKMKAYQQ